MDIIWNLWIISNFILKNWANRQKDNQCIDIYEKNSSATMTQFIVERALKLIGGESGDGLNGDALVAEYKSIL